MSNSPVKIIGAMAQAMGVQGNVGSLNVSSLFGGRRGGIGEVDGAKGRIKGLENRVSALENMGSQTNAAGASMAAANVDVSQPGTATVDGSVGGYGNFNPGTMQMENNAVSSDPMQGIQNVQSKIAAPGPLSTQEEGFMSDNLLNSL